MVTVTSSRFAISSSMRQSSPPIVCLTEETVEIPVLLGRAGPDRRRLRLRRAAATSEAREAAGIGFHLRDIQRSSALEPDLVLAFPDLQPASSPISFAPASPSMVFNQRGHRGILAMIRTLARWSAQPSAPSNSQPAIQRRLTASRLLPGLATPKSLFRGMGRSPARGPMGSTRSSRRCGGTVIPRCERSEPRRMRSLRPIFRDAELRAARSG